MFDLPLEIVDLIFEFRDGNKKDNFDKVLDELNDEINSYNISFQKGYFSKMRDIKWMRWREKKKGECYVELEKNENEMKKYYHVLKWKINFGKYKGSIYGALPDYYTEWLLSKDILKGDLKEYFTLREKIKDIERNISYYMRDGYD